MTIIGEAFIAVSPESAGFASKLNAQLAGLGSKIGLSGGQIGAITAVGAALAAAAVSGAEFARSQAQIQRETGATGERLAGLAETVRTVFTEVPASLDNVTTAVDELTRRGVPLGNSLDKLSKQELFLAKITGDDLSATVEATTAIFAKFNVPIAQQSRELDVLFKAQQQSGKGLSDLLGPLRASAAIFQQFGFNIEQSTALISSLERAGVNVQPALQALRLSFGKVAAAGGDPRKALADIIEELRGGVNPTKAMADAIALFGRRTGAELAIAIKSGRFATDDLLKLITNGRDGIVATGEATLTLGDQFTLLKNRVFAAIEPLGIGIANVLKTVTAAASGPLAEVIASIVQIVQVIGPALLPTFKVIGATLALIAPILSEFAAGLSEVAQILGFLPKNVLAYAAAFVVLRIATLAYTNASLLALRASVAFDAAIAFAATPVGAMIIAVTALGAALKFLDSQEKKQVDTGKVLADSFSDVNGQINVGVASLTEGVKTFILAGDSLKKIGAGDLPATLGAAGSSVSQLSGVVTGGAQSWTIYEGQVFKALRAAGNGPKQLNAAAIALDRTRAAVIASVLADVARLKNAGLISAAQVDQAQKLATLANGTIDYGKALLEVNRIASQNAAAGAAQVANADAAALAAFRTTDAFRELVSQLSRGTITADEFTSQLSSMADVTSAAAKAVGDEMVSAMQSFVSTALGALPTVGSAIDKFGSDVASAQDKVKAALSSQASDVGSAQKSLADSFASSADSLANAQASLADALKSRDEAVASATNAYEAAQARHSDSVINAERRVAQVREENNKRIAEAQANLAKVTRDKADEVLAANAKLAHDRSPQAFIDNLNNQTKLTATFMANLQRLVAEGFTPLAAELAKKGPEAAGALTANLATDPVKAAAANKAASIGEAVTSSFKAFLLKNFDPIKNDGVQLGTSLIDGIIKGIDDSDGRLTKRISRLGDDVVQVLAGQWGIKSPSAVAAKLGTQFGEGLALGLAGSVPTVSSAATLLTDVTTNAFARFQSSHLSALTRSGLSITGQTGSQRSDAQTQTNAANGIFAGATLNFPERTSPIHVASELAWRLRS